MVVPSRQPRWSLLVFAACLIYAVWAASIGWHNTVLDFIGFRQAQTALTAYFMVGQPPRLAYETPVVGPPWSIPFELPLYQWIVAANVRLFATPMDETGRAVSLLFFLLTLIPAYRLLAWLEFTHEHRLMALSVFLVSPFYIFWSRTFLIESTALFFSMSYLAAALPAVEKPSLGCLSAAFLFGVVAALVKITTCFVFSLLVLLYLLHVGRSRGRDAFHAAELSRSFLLSMCLVGIPFAAGWGWTRFADEQKALNPIGRHLTTSSEVMHHWNYGSFEQRRQWATWGAILTPAHYALGHGIVFVFALLALFVARRRGRIFLACLLVYPIAPLVFTNLYSFHEYYAFANNVLLLAAVAVSLLALLERGGRCRIVGSMGLAGFLALAVWRHQEYYRPIQAHNCAELNAVSDTIQRLTRPEDVLVILGCDWSSELPYYSRRRSLCIPFWLNPSVEKLPDYLALEPPYRVGAVVVHSAWQPLERAAVESAIHRAGFEVEYYRADDDFEVYAVREGLQSARLP
jgi:hypothetical protein